MTPENSNVVKSIPTVLTLTLPEAESESKTGTLLVQRGDLARVHQFTYERVADLTEVIADALIAFTAVEADPPVVPDLPMPCQRSRMPPSVSWRCSSTSQTTMLQMWNMQ